MLNCKTSFFIVALSFSVSAQAEPSKLNKHIQVFDELCLTTVAKHDAIMAALSNRNPEKLFRDAIQSDPMVKHNPGETYRLEQEGIKYEITFGNDVGCAIFSYGQIDTATVTHILKNRYPVTVIKAYEIGGVKNILYGFNRGASHDGILSFIYDGDGTENVSSTLSFLPKQVLMNMERQALEVVD